MIGFEEEKKVYVAHFDILGMKSLLEDSSWGAWQTILDLSEAQDIQELPITDKSRNQIVERFFSDTIIITTIDDSLVSLHTIMARSLELFRCALRSSIPLRGGIAHGSWFETKIQNKDLFASDALSKAYQIGEAQQMLGIILCDIVFSRFTENPFRFTSKSKVVIEYNVPLKNNESEKRAILNWPAICNQELSLINCANSKCLCDYFYAFGSFDKLNSDAKSKYTNTVEFLMKLAR